jgi:hypothetical protein
MRFIALLQIATTVLLSSTAVFAQPTEGTTTATTSQTTITSVTQTLPAPPKILSISLPPNARLRFDIDARDEDVLGVVKSLLRGFKGQSLKELLASFNMSNVAATGKSTTPSTALVDIEKAAAIQLLSDADLGTMLRDVNHVRLVVFETPSKGYGYSVAERKQRTQAAISTISHYEAAYITREGGRRIARGDFDDVQMLTVGFSQGGFGMVFQAPGMGMVLRADGYPDFEGVGPLVMASVMQFMPRMR